MTKKQLVVAFDCDGTLWDNGDYGDEGHMNSKVVALFEAFKRLGCYMIVWSAGGKLWAEEVSKNCGIQPDECRDKPPAIGYNPDGSYKFAETGIDIAIDDYEDLGTVTLFV